MKSIRRVLDMYLQASLHVALSVYCLIRLTEFMLHLPTDHAIGLFGFCGTVAGYNFIKYDALLRSDKPTPRLHMRALMGISFIASAACAVCFFMLRITTQITAVGLLVVTVLYAVPFFPNRSNARSWAGLKIYVVALSWAGVTVLLPVLNAGYGIGSAALILLAKRFILIIVLLLIFEIIDLAWDDPHLRTVPQQIGVLKTKQLGGGLLILFCSLSLFLPDKGSLAMSLIPVALTAPLLAFASERRSKYYTWLVTESVPVVWWLIVYFCK